LIREGFPSEKISVTENTLVETLMQISAELDSGELRAELQGRLEVPSAEYKGSRRHSAGECWYFAPSPNAPRR
jgi:hypothetical protein